MKIGDLIRFMPNWISGEGGPDWSSPGIVIRRYPPPDEALWVVHVVGFGSAVVEENNYHIEILTST